MSTIDTEVRLTIKRMSPLVWATAFGLMQDRPLVRGGLGDPEGNRRARRKAAAKARKGLPVSDLASVDPDTIRSMFADAKARAVAAHIKRLAENMELTREWQAAQAVVGRIIDTATPEQRAAREMAMDEEWRRIEEAEAASSP